MNKTAERKKLPFRAYRAGRQMTAMGKAVMPGDLVPGAHRSANLAECVSLSYLIPVEEAELTDEEIDALVEAEVAEQHRRLAKERPDAVIARAGQTPKPGDLGLGAPDVILQDSGNVRERAANQEIEDRAVEHSNRARRRVTASEGAAQRAENQQADDETDKRSAVEGTGASSSDDEGDGRPPTPEEPQKGTGGTRTSSSGTASKKG